MAKTTDTVPYAFAKSNGVVVTAMRDGLAEVAVREGARAGALTNDDEAIRETLAAAVTPLPADRIHTAIEPPESEPPRNADPRGSLLTVRASSPRS